MLFDAIFFNQTFFFIKYLFPIRTFEIFAALKFDIFQARILHQYFLVSDRYLNFLLFQNILFKWASIEFDVVRLASRCGYLASLNATNLRRNSYIIELSFFSKFCQPIQNHSDISHRRTSDLTWFGSIKLPQLTSFLLRCIWLWSFEHTNFASPSSDCFIKRLIV